MEKVKKVSRDLYYHPFIRYVVIGGTTFALDFIILVLLHGMFDVNLFLAATISYWASIAFNFLSNRYWTFGATETHIAKHLAAYLTLLGCNYLFTLVFLAGATHFGMHYAVAKILAVGIQTAWTYMAYKKFIFR